MIKKLFILLAVALLPFQGLNFSHAVAANPNLISNPSVENMDATSQTPTDWSNGLWGNNTASFSIVNTGYLGGNATKVTMTNFVDGDAKWYFKPVSVDSANQYNFSDYYTSDVITEAVALYLNSSGAESYGYLGSVPASSGWKRASFVIRPPTGTTTMTVFHLLNKVGNLRTDNYSLQVAETSVITSNVPNNSVKQSLFTNPKIPMDWQSSSWGTNTAIFSYLNTGHRGTKSLKTQITSYTSGDAKWYYTPQKIEGGKTYLFSDFYKSNIISKVTLMITKTDGSVAYMNLKDAAASSTVWAQYKGYFTAPIDAATLTVFHMINAVGYVTTDDYSVVPSTLPIFNQPLISITFDDGWQSQYTEALPTLLKYQFPATFYLTSGFIGQPSYLTKQEAHALQNAGNEIGSHSATHPFLTQLTLAQINTELNKSKNYLQNEFGPINSFALPYDDYNDTVINRIKKYYPSARISDNGYNNINNFDNYRLKTQNVLITTTTDEINGWIAQSKADHSYLILLYHQVDNNGGEYSVTPENFDLQMSAIKSSGVKTSTISQALAELTPQLIK